MENILKNNQNKEIFLKAIILGINYGKSDKSNYYLDNIQKELLKIHDYNNNHIQNTTNTKSHNILNNDSQKNLILKYNNNIANLEKDKIDTINLIYILSKNYSYNYSKINYLKNNLIEIDKEIIKNKLILNKLDISTLNNKEINIDNKLNNQLNKNINNNINNQVNYQINNQNQIKYQLNHQVNNKLNHQVNNNINNQVNNKINNQVNNNIFNRNNNNKLEIISNASCKKIDNENIVNELEKTLNNLSTLLIK